MLAQIKAGPGLGRGISLPGVWLVTVVAIAALGVLHEPPRAVLPLVIWVPVAAFLAGFAASSGFREWILALNTRWLVGIHVLRVPIGIAFLGMLAADRFPFEFAVPGGTGDIIIGVSAILAASLIPFVSAFRVRMVLLWNVLGLTDILLVFASAQRIIWAGNEPGFIGELTGFPLLIVPMFMVPMVIITHLVIFAHLLSRSHD
jgi:hypothetical protein